MILNRSQSLMMKQMIFFKKVQDTNPTNMTSVEMRTVTKMTEAFVQNIKIEQRIFARNIDNKETEK
jgi:hypothetical protein